MSGRVPLGVLVSGVGTNLQALLEACEAPEFPGEVAAVISNRSSAPALLLAEERGVEHAAMPLSQFGGDAAARDRAIRDRLVAGGVRLVVCAGYDRLLCDEFLAAFPDAIINIHPSLLPAFAGGMTAVEDALAHGVKVSGCSVQLLEPGEADGGPIISQAPVPVEEGDDAGRLRARIHEQEWRLLPEAVSLWCRGRLELEGRCIRVRAEGGPPGVRRRLL